MNVVVNGDRCEIANDATIASLLAELELEPRTVAVELNQDIAPREQYAEQRLAEGDQLEIVTLVGGG